MSPSEPQGDTPPPVCDPLALVSVHDLMPTTMPAVRRTLALLERYDVHPVTLLVVPGTGWDARGIAELRAMHRAGYVLAGHGWQHRVERIRGLRHRLHSLLLSRNVAEHMALDADGILALMRRCRNWFERQDLPPPTLYVPPAWALGAIPAETLGGAGLFRQVEVFSGVLDIADGGLRPVPVLGYEADAPLRAPVLRLWNGRERRRAASTGALRVGIHPYDIDHPLRRDLIADLKRYRGFADYGALLSAPAATTAGDAARRPAQHTS